MDSVATFTDRFKELVGDDTYQAVSDRINVARSTVCAYINGDRTPKKPVLLNIAHAYRVNPLWLMGYDVDKTENIEAGGAGDAELTEYLEALRSRPECRMLFSLAKDATKADVEKAVAIIEALRGIGDK